MSFNGIMFNGTLEIRCILVYLHNINNTLKQTVKQQYKKTGRYCIAWTFIILKNSINLLCLILLICKKDKILSKSFLNTCIMYVKISIWKSPSTGWQPPKLSL